MELLQLAFEGLPGPDRVPAEFSIDLPKVTIPRAASLPGCGGGVEAIVVLLSDQRVLELSGFTGLSLGEEFLGVVDHASLTAPEPAVLRGSCVKGASQWQVQRGRECEVGWWCDAEEVGHQRVGHLVVFRTADAVYEEVGQEDAGKQRCRECTGPDPQAVLLQLAEVCGELIEVSGV